MMKKFGEQSLIWEGYAARIKVWFCSMHVRVNRKGKSRYKGLREEEKGPAKAPHASVLISGRHKQQGQGYFQRNGRH
jgi:hypothetical protein